MFNYDLINFHKSVEQLEKKNEKKISAGLIKEKKQSPFLYFTLVFLRLV